VGAKRSFDLLAVDDFGSGPALRRAEHDHRPRRSRANAVFARVGLDATDVAQRGIQRLGHLPVQARGIIALDEVRHVAVAAHELLQLRVRDAGQDGGVGDLPSVQMQDRQHGAVGRR